jgi:hypothetical protein
MSLHFINSTYGQAGKSWFIRAIVEIFARTDDRIIVVDASIDKRIGMTYSPAFNRAYDLQFSSQDACAIDKLLDFGADNTVIVKLPASDLHHLIRWGRDTDIQTLGFPCYYWFVSTGRDDYPFAVLDLFGDRNCFLVENHDRARNFRAFGQPEFDPERVVRLPCITTDPVEIYRIEHSQKPLAALMETADLPILTKSRIYRFLQNTAESLEPIATRNFYRDRMCRDVEHTA